MPMKGSGPATDFEEIDRRDEGVGWIAYPDERMERASHAFAVDGEVWVVDPVDVDGLDELLAEFGDVAGVVTLLDRHKRDADTVASSASAGNSETRALPSTNSSTTRSGRRRPC